MKFPSEQDLLDFHRKYVSVAGSPKGLLYVESQDAIKWTELANHPTFKWFQQSDGFKSAIQTLMYKKILNDKEDVEKETIRLASICCTLFYLYLMDIKHPFLITVTNKSTQNKAIKPAEKLMELFNNGLQLQDSDHTYTLRNLLAELHSEITNVVPTSYPTEKKGHLIDKKLVQDIYDVFISIYGQAPTTAIFHIFSIIDNTTQKRQIERYVKSHREYLDNRRAYDKRKKARDALIDAMLTTRQK